MSDHNIVFNNFCYAKHCKEYIEWDLDVCSPDGQQDGVYVCTSCQAVGQSYDIDKISFSCPHLDEIVEFKREVNVRNRSERKEQHKQLRHEIYFG